MFGKVKVTSRMYGECPKCKFQCWSDSISPEPDLVERKDVHDTDTDYGPGQDWTEVWKCPQCENVFEEENGYP